MDELVVPARGSRKPLRRSLVALANTANREHEKALANASSAVEHAVKSGEALAKARELCDTGEWSDLIAGHFIGSLRTAQKYMRIARHFRMLSAQAPGKAITSQNEAVRALTAIMVGDGVSSSGGRVKRTRRARGACQTDASSVASSALSLLVQVERQLAEITPVPYLVRVAIETIRRGAAELAQLGGVGVEVKADSKPNPLTAPEALDGGHDAIA